jgi:geranylgeranyl diphosphate synthase type II
MAYQLYQPSIEKALPAAFGMELFHNFTLIHDDIMDDAAMRRGAMTVHEKFGMNTAILSGDAMMMLAYKYLQQSADDAHLPEVIRTMTRTAIEVCEGQDLDMSFEGRSTVTVDEYLQMITLKTSVLLAAALKIGGILAGADSSDAEHLYAFGRNLGIAFQIQDDILDAFGHAREVGKKIGGDILQKKKTFLFTKALEVLSAARKEELLAYYGSDNEIGQEGVELVKALFREGKVPDLANRAQEEYYMLAMEHLDAVSVVETAKTPLKSIARKLFERSQ